MSHKNGVYIIRNTITDDIYIGSTTRGFGRRWKEHRGLLGANTHYNKFLQRAWNKYGEHSFVFEVLEVTEKGNTLEREQYWIDSLTPRYNLSLTAGSTAGLPKSKNWKEKMSASMTAVWRSVHGREKILSGIRSLKTRQKISRSSRAYWDSDGARDRQRQRLNERYNDPDQRQIQSRQSKIAMNDQLARKKIANGVAASWLNDEIRNKRVEGIRKTRGGLESRAKTSNQSARSYNGFIDPDGEVHKNIFNLTLFCEQRGLDPSSMIKVYVGKRATHKGWRKL